MTTCAHIWKHKPGAAGRLWIKCERCGAKPPPVCTCQPRQWVRSTRDDFRGPYVFCPDCGWEAPATAELFQELPTAPLVPVAIDGPSPLRALSAIWSDPVFSVVIPRAFPRVVLSPDEPAYVCDGQHADEVRAAIVAEVAK